MVEPEPMSLPERWKYLRLLQPRYASGTRRQRSDLLDEAEQVTGRHRKSLIRLLRGRLTHKPRTRQRGRSYGPQVEYAVRLVARTLDFPCAERLQPARLDRARRGLLPMAHSLASHGELELSADLLDRLGCISVSTVGRMVQRMRRDGHPPRLARRRPSSRNPLTRSIPAGRLPRDLPEPGHFEVDLVHHAGDSASGQYVHTLQLIDVATGWSERVALLGRSYTVMQDAFARLDTVAQTNLLNQIYDRMWLLHNFFHPVMRQQPALSEAEGPALADRPGNGSPCSDDRLCAATTLDPQRQATLAELRSTTNPLQLRNEVHALLDHLSRLSNARAGRPQDVRRTLFQPIHETASVTLSIEGSFTAR